MKKIILLLISSTFIAACSDISKIKDGRLDDYPEYTISQAFDNRSVCLDTTWETIEDQRGRTLVEYKCTLKGVSEFYIEKIQKRLWKIDKDHERRMNEATASLDKAKKEIQPTKDELNELISKPVVSEEEYEKLLHSGGYYGTYTQRKKENEKTRLQRKISLYEEIIIGSEKTFSDLIDQHQQRRSPQEKLMAEAETIRGYEYYQWAILEGDSFSLSSAGIELASDGEFSKSLEYDTYRNPLNHIYSNKNEDFSDFAHKVCGRKCY